MSYLWATLLVLLNAGWLATVVLGLPGTWLMVVSTVLVAWWQRDGGSADSHGMFSPATLVAIVVLAALGEVLELVAGLVGAQRAGGTRRGALGALAGGFLGALVGTFVIPVPLLGSLLGACAGAAVGAWGLELAGGRKLAESARSGLGAGVGTFVGRSAKLVVGVLIWLIVALAAFWP